MFALTNPLRTAKNSLTKFVPSYNSTRTTLLSSMATPYQMHISPENSGLWKFPQTEEAAKKASQLLQKDLEEHHVFFNNDGFHNHISHQILALYGTGAGPQSMQQGYNDNTGYQRPAMKPHGRVPEDLQNWNHARKYLARDQHYADFLAFFQREIDAKGWQAVLNEYLFAGTDAADDLLARLHAGFLHPLIQMMYGVEWEQPAGVAEALAQTCVHGVDLKAFLLEAETSARESSEQSMLSVVQLLEEVRTNEALARSAHMGDSNKIRDGVLKRARDQMLAVVSKVKVRPEELEEKTVEMFNACVYMAASSAIHPPKYPKFDFFFIHHVNSAPFYLSINSQSWISTETKVRLLEWKIRMDLIQYAGRACPALGIDKIASYKPKHPEGAKSPVDVVRRLHDVPDDGHAIKLARATGICHEISQKYEDRDWMALKGEDLWMKAFHMVVDSVQSPGQTWVRTAGLEEAWEDVPDQSKL